MKYQSQNHSENTIGKTPVGKTPTTFSLLTRTTFDLEIIDEWLAPTVRLLTGYCWGIFF